VIREKKAHVRKKGGGESRSKNRITANRRHEGRARKGEELKGERIKDGRGVGKERIG